MGCHVTRDTIAMRPTDFERLDAPYPAPPYTTRTQQATEAKSAIAEAAAHSRVETILLGGRLNKQEQVAMGASILDELRHYRADLRFPGVCSLHPEAGIGAPEEEAQIKRAMIAHSAEVAANPSALAPYRALEVTAIVGE